MGVPLILSMKPSVLLIALLVLAVNTTGGAAIAMASGSPSKFGDLFQPLWAFDHFVYQGDVIKLKLDKNSGAGFASKRKYLFGKVTLQIKLVEGDTAGTVTAFYMSSEGPKHNEFDFEFLGNTSGEPYLVQTNVYVNGVGNREQRFSLWFDPTKDFHYYSISWTPHRVLFLVDETLVRVHSNLEHRGVAFPKDQAMGVYSSIWNADDWATRGGLVKTDWSHAPFVASYRGFDITGCEYPMTNKKCNNGDYLWVEEPHRHVGVGVGELSYHQNHQLKWVRAKHLVYDYCLDSARFPVTPTECIHHHHYHY